MLVFSVGVIIQSCLFHVHRKQVRKQSVNVQSVNRHMEVGALQERRTQLSFLTFCIVTLFDFVGGCQGFVPEDGSCKFLRSVSITHLQNRVASHTRKMTTVTFTVIRTSVLSHRSPLFLIVVKSR